VSARGGTTSESPPQGPREPFITESPVVRGAMNWVTCRRRSLVRPTIILRAIQKTLLYLPEVRVSWQVSANLLSKLPFSRE